MRELALIEALERILAHDSPRVVRWIGDDAAVVRARPYAVTSVDVYAFEVPPAASSLRSNSFGPNLREPLNIMCSKRWLMPVIPGLSLREPTRKKL